MTEAKTVLQQSPQSSNTATEAEAALQQSPQSSNTVTEAKAALQQSPQSSNTVTEAEVEALRELYDHLGPALPPQRLCFDAEPLLEPAATDRALTGGASRRWQRGARNTTTIQPWEARNTATTPRRQARTVALLQEYRQFLEATGSDFLHAIFQLSGGDDGDEEAPGEHPGVTAEPPPPPVTPKPTPTPTPEELQRRLHRLWAALRVPVREQVAMATKYGPATARRRLAAALVLWDEAAALIRRRERLLALLEGLELRASDPNRFFHRGARALAARLGEARARDRLSAAAERCQGALRTALRRLREEFGDAVTLRGRSYEEKARRDRGEMLYRLQQARRAAAMGNIVRPAPGAQR
ncbi:coiled-coil domain-containing protein 87-like [Numida meleagris]|uniref:coiled-coil domain-containing protein 87-like n=1 Tax=Numida meleagris TaxID=8996 RepID=UPI000B3D7E98|nr:coiled-coil domain-containing protein 87-like [Numida meleagris]